MRSAPQKAPSTGLCQAVLTLLTRSPYHLVIRLYMSVVKSPTQPTLSMFTSCLLKQTPICWHCTPAMRNVPDCSNYSVHVQIPARERRTCHCSCCFVYNPVPPRPPLPIHSLAMSLPRLTITFASLLYHLFPAHIATSPIHNNLPVLILPSTQTTAPLSL